MSWQFIKTTQDTHNADWRLKRDRLGVKVYVGHNDQSDFHCFKAVSKVKTSVSALVNLMRDLSAMEQWLDTCRDPVVVAEPDGVSRVIHMKNNSPFMLISDRDLVILQRFRRISDRVVMVDLVDHGYMVDPVDGHVRGEFNGHWQLTQINEREVRVEYVGHTDPGGAVAPWMANMAVLDIPYRTLRKIRKILHSTNTQYNGPACISLSY